MYNDTIIWLTDCAFDTKVTDLLWNSANLTGDVYSPFTVSKADAVEPKDILALLNRADCNRYIDKLLSIAILTLVGVVLKFKFSRAHVLKH